jgi:hypothetical protein
MIEDEMKATRSVLWALAIAILLLTACNYDEGQCWLRSEDDGQGGVAGGPIVPTGAGGFGDVPPKPQDATDPPPPDCNIVADSPCNEKCLADYVEEAAKCGKMENEAQRKTCQDGAYAVYKGCRQNCQQSDNEKCKKACEKVYNNCMDKCKDGKCRDECFNDYVECLRECDR